VNQEGERGYFARQTPTISVVVLAEVAVAGDIGTGNRLIGREGGVPPAIGGLDVGVLKATGVNVDEVTGPVNWKPVSLDDEETGISRFRRHRYDEIQEIRCDRVASELAR
jgi:hypothetical protein